MVNLDPNTVELKETIVPLLPACYSMDPLPSVDFEVHKDLALLPFSSGTTGPPKVVMISHLNFAVAVQNCYW
ncbi:unnamed protein product [Soboliphyme baturini]|uniref:AMP-binding domain-containing protein n=1 Tax=Soboliphyme baturini TaxID=241478 RepID=A0A183IMS3_9BILA|nr:unnamed protein product [Soboliphyme baturini]